jgi:hypothetical protein
VKKVPAKKVPAKKVPAKKKKKFEAAKEVRAIARERVGTVKPSRVIQPKNKPKPKPKPEELEEF